MFSEECDSFTASLTGDRISTYVVETPGPLGAAFESQVDSALEHPKREPGEKMSGDTIRQGTEAKILAHVTVKFDWYWKKKKNYRTIIEE